MKYIGIAFSVWLALQINHWFFAYIAWDKLWELRVIEALSTDPAARFFLLMIIFWNIAVALFGGRVIYFFGKDAINYFRRK